MAVLLFDLHLCLRVVWGAILCFLDWRGTATAVKIPRKIENSWQPYLNGRSTGINNSILVGPSIWGWCVRILPSVIG
jgi:hypothetical protein